MRKPKPKNATATRLPERGNVVVNNTQPRAIFLPPRVDSSGRRHASKLLAPGQNNVDVAHWRACVEPKPRPGLRSYIALGYLECLGEGEAEVMPRGFDGMSDIDVRQRLDAMDDLESLISLRDLTASAALVSMVNERIKELQRGDTED